MCIRFAFFIAFIFSLCFLVPISSPAQTAPASPVEALYVVSDSGIQTYDVDPQTGMPTDEGLTVVEPESPIVFPSANDHFLYVVGTNPGTGKQELWVYATTATGVPQTEIQQVTLPNYVSDFTIERSGALAYAVWSNRNSHGEEAAGIFSFTINPTTGLVTAGPTLAATYPPNGPCDAGASAGLGLIGFNPSGNQLDEGWFCDDHDSVTETYYTRQVNQQTGALGPDVQIFTWQNGSQGSVYVNITPPALFDFNIPNDFNKGISSLSVYPPTGGTTPLFTCTAAMLEACGYAVSDAVDPLGNYVFFQVGTNNTQITKVDLPASQIVNTGYFIPDLVMSFSPDGTLIYTHDVNVTNSWIIPIYLFNPATGAVTEGGKISLPPPFFFTVVPAVRN
jgi:hypothetical protein